MSTIYAILISLALCTLAAALESVCAGKDVKSYFATLRSPSYAPPFFVWIVIGVGYYATFFFVLYRVLKLNTDLILRPVTLSLVVFMMTANALWNYVSSAPGTCFLLS